MGALDTLNSSGAGITTTNGVLPESSIPTDIARDTEINDASLTFTGSATGTFTANDSDNLTVNIPSANNGTLTVTGGAALTGSGTFTANQAGNTTITLNHQDTSGQGTITNNGQFINGLTLDTYGHVTGFTRASAGGSGNNTSTTAVGAYAMMASTNPTNQNTGINTSFSGNTSVYQYGGVSAGVNNYTFNPGNRTEFPRNGNIPSGTWRFRAAGGTNTGRCVLVQRVS